MTARVLAAARDLVASTQPAVVLASLAAISVPTFSEGCHVLVEEHDTSGGATDAGAGPHPLSGAVVAYRISNPQVTDPSKVVEPWNGSVGGGDQRITTNAVTTPLRVPVLVGAPDYRGTVVHHWDSGYQPGPADAALAQLLVVQAVTLVHTERVQALLEDARSVVGQLQEAVASNRDIGAAVGILMHARHLTYEQALRALVTTSQHSNTKLRTVCQRVLADRALLAAPDDRPHRP